MSQIALSSSSRLLCALCVFDLSDKERKIKATMKLGDCDCCVTVERPQNVNARISTSNSTVIFILPLFCDTNIWCFFLTRFFSSLVRRSEDLEKSNYLRIDDCRNYRHCYLLYCVSCQNSNVWILLYARVCVCSARKELKIECHQNLQWRKHFISDVFNVSFRFLIRAVCL